MTRPRKQLPSTAKKNGKVVWVAIALLAGLALWLFLRERNPAGPPDTTGASKSSSNQRLREHRKLEPVTKIHDRRLAPSSLRELIGRLLNPQESISARQAAAIELARDGSTDAMAALATVLRDGPLELKSKVTEALAECPSPEASALLVSLVMGDDERIARTAIRSLAKLGGAEAIEALSSILLDNQKSVELRTEAASALGELRAPGSLAALALGLREIRDPAVLEFVLDGLGHHPFSEIEPLFRDFIKRDDIPAESRISAVEALGHSTDQATPFLLSLGSDADAKVRAAAGWALVASDDPGDIRSQLMTWMTQESDSTVRMRLYQALARQDDVQSSAVLPLVQRETNPEARLAALGLLAGAIRSDNGAEAATYFDSTAVGELRTVAYGSARLDQSLGAVMALDRAGTDGSIALLREISQHPTDTKLRAAAQQALKRHKVD